jgi:hypothetical protein
MADKYGSLTTYNYAGNNPVIFNDPNGDDFWDDIMNMPSGSTWENPDKEEQDYQPGFNPFGDAQAAMDRADAMADAMNGVYNPLWQQMTYGTPAPRIGAGGGQWVKVTTDIYNKMSIRGTDIVLGYEFSHTEISYRYEEQEGDHWWFDDKQGEILGMHWLNGSGKSLFFNDKSWQDYMESNSVIGGTIAGILHDDARKRTESGTQAKRIFIELAENDRSTGYGMLHGTLNFDYAFEATVINANQIQYSCTFIWNDRIDPSARQGDTPWATLANLFYSPADYDITIKWTHTYIVDK